MMICDICVFDLYGMHTRTWTGKSGNTYRKAVLVLVVVVYWMLLSVVPLSFCHLLNLLVRRTLYTPIGPTSPVPLGHRRHPRAAAARLPIHPAASHTL